ncbi:MAG: hypothetical protein AABX65_03065 [Nanoarchaeota archaeon]
MRILVGFKTKVEEDFSGLEFSLINENKGDFTGVANAVGVNNVNGNANGVYNAVVGNGVGGNANGVYSAGGVNGIRVNANGVYSAGGVNLIFEKLRGLSIATINYTKKLRGVQIGVLNICGEDSKGVQIGVINYRTDGRWYSRVSPVIAIRTGKKEERQKESELVERLNVKMKEEPEKVNVSIT